MGVEIYPNGNIYRGKWNNDEKTGDGIFTADLRGEGENSALRVTVFGY